MTVNRINPFAIRGVVLVTLAVLAYAVYRVWPASDSGEQPVTGDAAPVRQLIDFRPTEVPAGGYVKSNACRECHPREHESWTASYHRTMTQLVTPETVPASFEGVTFTDIAHHRSYRLWWEGAQLQVRMPDPGTPDPALAELIDRPIVMSTGSHHMQVYWYSAGSTRVLGQLPIVYLKGDDRWAPRNSVFMTPPDGETFFSELGRWNFGCIECHTTHGRPRPQPDGSLDTQVAEFGIACEACHGPGETHVAIHQNSPSGEATAADHIVNPARLTHERSAQVCGRCHSLSMPLSRDDGNLSWQRGIAFRPGDDLHMSRFVVGVNEESIAHIRSFTDRFDAEESMSGYLDDSFWSDGEIRVAGREYNGISESACYQHGEMSCVSCHKLHDSVGDRQSVEQWANDQLNADLLGDRACLQCHDSQAYQSDAHTHHLADSSGSRCYNCHMPHTTYGLLKAIRTHRISSPDVTVTLQTGRPNACNLCHLDKTLDWSAQSLLEWYGTPKPEMSDDQRTISAAAMWVLTGDACQRALVAASFGWEPARETSGTDWMPPLLSALLEDPYDAVRYIAGRSLTSLPDYGDLEYDFISSPQERTDAARTVFDAWANRAAQRTPNEALLIDPDGRLQRDVFDRLRSMRDDRPVLLSE